MKIREDIKELRRKVLVHSCLYYCMDESLVDDHTWQRWANDLAVMQIENPVESFSVGYYDSEFEYFTGGTGFDLPMLEPEIVKEANELLLQNGRYPKEPHLPL